MSDPYSPYAILERRLCDYFDRRCQRLEDALAHLEGLVRAGNRFDRTATEALMLDLSDLQAEVSRNTTVDASIKALCLRIADSIDGADQAQIDQLVDMLRNDNDSVAQFVVENTPADTGGGTGGGDTGGTPTDGGTDTGTGDGTDTGEPVG